MRTVLVTVAIVLAACSATEPEPRPQWTPAQAYEWYEGQPWLVGANFVPSTAVNQLEMWQAETFDEATIDRELGWAADLGFDTVRVFLHDLLWSEDPEGFLERVERFLTIADSHGIGTMLVLLDGIWDPEPMLGPQPDPVPYVHNSRWVQSPGREILGDPSRHGELEGYVKGVIGHFRTDERVVVWDLFNEGENANAAYAGEDLRPVDKSARALELATLVFEWARAMDPSQPITAGAFNFDTDAPEQLSAFNAYVLDESDVVTFHSYDPPATLSALIALLEGYGRPIICTEYMARPLDSTFEGSLPIFKEQGIGAYNWGLVVGRTQTNYHWLSWVAPGPDWADPWFHDILHEDGTPYDEAEAALIREITGRE